MYKEVTRMKVIHNDYALLELNTRYAMTDGVNIYIDDEFYTLSNSLKKFILEHEKAHIVLKHDLYKTNDFYQEHEADMYALEYAGIEAAKEFVALTEEVDVRNKTANRIVQLKSHIKTKECIDSIISSGDEDRISILIDVLNDAADLFGSIAEELR